MKHIMKMMFAFLLASTMVYAQNQNPRESVQELKSAGAIFQEVNPFSLSSQQKSQVALPSEMKEFSLLSLKTDELSLMKSSSPETMSMVIPGTDASITLELVKSTMFADNFVVTEMPSGKNITSQIQSNHYRGVVKGQPNSIAAISILDGEISGVISIDGDLGNLVIGKLDNSDQHIIYKDAQIEHLNNTACRLLEDDTLEGYTDEQLQFELDEKAPTKCPEIFFDIASDIVNDKGGSAAASNYITALFNQVSVLYANDDISIKLGGLQVWTGNLPWSNELRSYTSYRERNSFNGDLAHFVTYNFSGGIAWVGGLCNGSSAAISGIRGSFRNVPTYSWSVMVVAHELGHNFGSQHTHACAWNGNRTQIDSCGGGGCGNAGIPSGGGTIMSYCHLKNVGINLNKGFGPQPKSVIQNYIANRNCVDTCDGGDQCTDGDAVTATFTNNTDCTVEYFWDNDGTLTSYGQLAEGQSKSQGTFVGHKWVVNQVGGATLDSFTISCTSTTYTTSGACASADKCANIEPWDPNKRPYAVGSKVTYRGGLYERLSRRWSFLGRCGSPLSESLEETEVSQGPAILLLYPSPATDVLTLDMTGLDKNASIAYIIDVTGKKLQRITLDKTPDGGVNQTIDIRNLNSGVYFLQVAGGVTSTISKFVVKK